MHLITGKDPSHTAIISSLADLYEIIAPWIADDAAEGIPELCAQIAQNVVGSDETLKVRTGITEQRVEAPEVADMILATITVDTRDDVPEWVGRIKYYPGRPWEPLEYAPAQSEDGLDDDEIESLLHGDVEKFRAMSNDFYDGVLNLVEPTVEAIMEAWCQQVAYRFTGGDYPEIDRAVHDGLIEKAVYDGPMYAADVRHLLHVDARGDIEALVARTAQNRCPCNAYPSKQYPYRSYPGTLHRGTLYNMQVHLTTWLTLLDEGYTLTATLAPEYDRYVVTRDGVPIADGPDTPLTYEDIMRFVRERELIVSDGLDDGTYRTTLRDGLDLTCV